MEYPRQEWPEPARPRDELKSRDHSARPAPPRGCLRRRRRAVRAISPASRYSAGFESENGNRRAELANRSRSSRRPEVGDKVLYSDPKLRKSCAGHAPGKRALRGLFEVRAVQGNKADLVYCETGVCLDGVHGDFLVAMPGLVDDNERPPLAVEPDDDATRPSLGRLLAQKGEGRGLLLRHLESHSVCDKCTPAVSLPMKARGGVCAASGRCSTSSTIVLLSRYMFTARERTIACKLPGPLSTRRLKLRAISSRSSRRLPRTRCSALSSYLRRACSIMRLPRVSRGWAGALTKLSAKEGDSLDVSFHSRSSPWRTRRRGVCERLLQRVRMRLSSDSLPPLHRRGRREFPPLSKYSMAKGDSQLPLPPADGLYVPVSIGAVPPME